MKLKLSIHHRQLEETVDYAAELKRLARMQDRIEFRKSFHIGSSRRGLDHVSYMIEKHMTFIRSQLAIRAESAMRQVNGRRVA